MSSPAVQLVQDLYDAFGRRDLPQILRLLSPDIELSQTAALPWGGTFRGHDGAQRFFAALTQHLSSTVSIDRIIDAIDHVVVIGRTRGHVNATGASYDIAIAHVWHLRDHRVARAQFFIDTPAMLSALNSPKS